MHAPHRPAWRGLQGRRGRWGVRSRAFPLSPAHPPPKTEQSSGLRSGTSGARRRWAQAGRPANAEVLPVGSEREPRVTLLGGRLSPRVSSAGSSLHLKRDAPRPERRLAKLRPVRRRQETAVSGPRLLNGLFSEATQETSPGSGSSAVHSPTLQAARAPFPSGRVNAAPAQDANGGRRPSAVTHVLQPEPESQRACGPQAGHGEAGVASALTPTFQCRRAPCSWVTEGQGVSLGVALPDGHGGALAGDGFIGGNKASACS